MIMQTSLVTPKPIKDIHQINEIIIRIADLVMAQQIYCTTRLNDEKPLTELIILISDKSSRTLIEYVPLLDMVFEDYPDYCYRLYHTQQAKDSIKKGNLFFYEVCAPGNLCYTDPTVDLNLFTSVQHLATVIDKAKTAFNREIAKIEAFNDGAHFYLEKENYALTALMIHQQIELAYRAIELFAMGKDKITHSIRVHQKHVGPYLPVLGKLFDESNDFENKLLQRLDDAYLAVRYEDNYQINKDKLLIAMKKAEEVKKIVHEIYEKMINDFNQKLQEKKAVPVIVPEIETKVFKKASSFDKQYAADLVNRITQHLTVERIYCVNCKNTSSMQSGIFMKESIERKSQHFLLLVITKESCNLDSFTLQNSINQSPDIPATVTLLVYSIQKVNEALLDNNLFFHEVLRSDQLIYQDESFSGLIELPEYDSIKGLSWAGFNWQQRKWRAEALLDAATNISEHETVIVEVSLLNQAMEQLCLGFIYASVGYKPNQQSLKHLVNICRCISPMFDEVFPTNTEDDRVVFDILIDSIKDTRYRVPFTIDPTDTGLLHRRCRAWMEKAEELVTELLSEPGPGNGCQ